jgi:glycine reductase
MAVSLRVAHYLNQFFGGIGGEEKANVPVEVQAGPLGPGRLFQQLLGDRGSIVSTIICGDNYVNERQTEARAAVIAALTDAGPDVLIAGPAFDAGRYGLACGVVCEIAQDLGIQAVSAMHPENPGVLTYGRTQLIVPTGTTPVDMQEAVARLHRIAVKLGTGEELGAAEVEGYLPRGMRKIATRDEPGYKRAVDMLVQKLKGQPYQTEVPFQAPEPVVPAAPIKDLAGASIALVSTGGLIPKGNPDRQTSGNPDQFFTYSIDGLPSLNSDEWEAFHGGYYNQISSDNPNYVLPLKQLRSLESQGVVGNISPAIFTMPGVSTPVAKSKRLGTEIAQQLKESKVDGCILVAT